VASGSNGLAWPMPDGLPRRTDTLSNTSRRAAGRDPPHAASELVPDSSLPQADTARAFALQSLGSTRPGRPAAPAPLPNIVHPGDPAPIARGGSGTGLFIAEDGSLLSAAHVVNGCQSIQIVSRTVPLTAATLLALDARHDLALLRAPRVRPAALLPVMPPARSTAAVGAFGYPGNGDMLVPSEAAGTLRNAALPAMGGLADPRELVWIEAPTVAKGFSGGPIIDARSGIVLGLIKGTLDPAFARAVFGAQAPAIAIGPGAGRIGAFLRREAPWIDPALPVVADLAPETMRKAVVHVLCWR
jgi:S1-C subfamily serine protease